MGEKNIILRKEVFEFALEMERKLQKHDNRRGYYSWKKNCTRSYLIHRLEVELRELKELSESVELSLLSLQHFGVVLSTMQINNFFRSVYRKLLSECADIGNFAMMIPDNLRAQELGE